MPMKKKIYTRPVSVVLSCEMYEQILELTDQQEISVSDYIREALQEKLANEKATMIINKEERS
jgi:Arc/MetJ-type ribon-helix-helix transcriptional regulator